ncbi:MAG: hypothetical protein K1X94_05260 [Sandaracinaceae bacterium]|nr:hypothetical protein [Sandaracinaceae bacterium]
MRARRGRWPASLPVLAATGLACGGAMLSSAPPVPAQELEVAPTTTRLSTERRTALATGTPVSLRTGFVPDPIVFRGQLAGTLPLSRLGSDCRGVSSEAPTQRVTMDTRFGFLRIFATGAADLTLAVQTSQGVVCSDDRFGRHPAIEGRFAPGEIAIWVGLGGAASESARGFELEITETRSIRPGVRRGEEAERLSLAIEAGLDTQPESGAQGDMRLRRGFLPDPRFLSGSIVPEERPVDVGGLADTCRGYVPTRPSHVLTLQDDLDFFQIYVAEATESTTLVVVGPDQSVSCDASEGDHPHVSRDAWPAGLYRIWVGAHRTDAAFPYRLGVSEIRRVR